MNRATKRQPAKSFSSSLWAVLGFSRLGTIKILPICMVDGGVCAASPGRLQTNFTRIIQKKALINTEMIPRTAAEGLKNKNV
jgi:hypothetical protein